MEFEIYILGNKKSKMFCFKIRDPFVLTVH
jgi:hypothetical protein